MISEEQKKQIDSGYFSLKVLRFTGPAPAEVYYTRFEGSGWALLIIDSDTGTVAIHSDYGDWTFSWPSPGRGPCTIKEFLCRGDFDYLANKFDSSRDLFDHEATVRSMVEQILDDRRSHAVDKEDARNAYNALQEMEECDEDGHFLDAADDALNEYFDNQVYEMFFYKKSGKFLRLKHGILPAIIEELRKTLQVKETAQ